ncbi:MAG: glycosyltransferase family 9 protein [Flavobacterium sp.]|nr:glycosyltransferase family 9 protein [Candidatus Neoflavobacterium equi]
MSKHKHILVIRLSAMGDVAMTVPVLRAFAFQYPEVKVTVVSRPFFKPFFDGIPNISFFGVDVKERHKGFAGLFRLFRDTKALGVDAVADLHNVLRSQILRSFYKFSGVAVAATDKGRADKKALTKLEVKDIQPVRTMVERHLDTFAALGYQVDLNQTQFPSPKPLGVEIKTITGEKNQKWIGVAPFAQYQSKVYPLDLMNETLQLLQDKGDAKIFLFGGGAEEIEKLNQLAAGKSNVVVVAGVLKFQSEIDLISNLDVMLSMDSGNAHIAAMLGVRVVTLWGATHPYAGFAPFNQSAGECLVSDRTKYPFLPTSVYGNKQVEGYEEAMRTIDPKVIVSSLYS